MVSNHVQERPTYLWPEIAPVGKSRGDLASPGGRLAGTIGGEKTEDTAARHPDLRNGQGSTVDSAPIE